MSRKLIASAVAGAVALAIGGTAAAATFDSSDLYLNVVDYTVSGGVESSTSYVADLGVSLSAFNPDQSYSFNLNDDSNFAGSVYAGVGLGSGTLGFSVIGATNTGPSQALKYTIDATTNLPESQWGSYAAQKSQEGNTYNDFAGVDSFLDQIGSPTNTFTAGGSTVGSAVLGSSNTYGQGAFEGGVSFQFLNDSNAPWGDIAAPGTALAFYTANGTTLTALGDWSLSDGILSYAPAGGGGTAPVPLPAPVLLMLSGLGLMGLVARRGKGFGSGFGAAA